VGHVHEFKGFGNLACLGVCHQGKRWQRWGRISFPGGSPSATDTPAVGAVVVEAGSSKEGRSNRPLQQTARPSAALRSARS